MGGCIQPGRSIRMILEILEPHEGKLSRFMEGRGLDATCPIDNINKEREYCRTHQADRTGFIMDDLL